MKCLLVTSYFPPTIGGSATVYGNIYKYAKGHVVVLTTAVCTDTASDENIYRIKHLMAPSVECGNIFQTIYAVIRYDLPTRCRVLITMLRLIRKREIDVVCIGELQELGWLVVLLKKLARVKVVIYTHGEEVTTVSTSRFYGKNAYAYLNKSDAVVCVSRYTHDIIQERYAIPESKLHLINNGIDLDEYTISKNPGLREDVGVAGEGLVFSAGRHIQRKGFDMAIRAMAIVQKELPHARLIIAGEGETTDRLREIIKALGLEEKVTLLGRVSHDELMAYYNSCDVFLMPNRTLENGDTEGFGLVFLEANAFGKPVIGGNSGGVTDAIIDGKTGILVDGTSPAEIAAAIVDLLSDGYRRRDMGKAGYEWAQANDVKIKVAEFLKCCESLLD
jgi:phosphatidylinositol alpha-1,6-mannosyltransferase